MEWVPLARPVLMCLAVEAQVRVNSMIEQTRSVRRTLAEPVAHGDGAGSGFPVVTRFENCDGKLPDGRRTPEVPACRRQLGLPGFLNNGLELGSARRRDDHPHSRGKSNSALTLRPLIGYASFQPAGVRRIISTTAYAVHSHKRRNETYAIRSVSCSK